jgi:hypothetical protein
MMICSIMSGVSAVSGGSIRLHAGLGVAPETRKCLAGPTCEFFQGPSKGRGMMAASALQRLTEFWRSEFEEISGGDLSTLHKRRRIGNAALCGNSPNLYDAALAECLRFPAIAQRLESSLRSRGRLIGNLQAAHQSKSVDDALALWNRSLVTLERFAMAFGNSPSEDGPGKVGRPRDDKIVKRDQIIREIAAKQRLQNQPAKLARLVNSDAKFKALQIGEVNRVIVGHVLTGRRRKKPSKRCANHVDLRSVKISSRKK